MIWMCWAFSVKTNFLSTIVGIPTFLKFFYMFPTIFYLFLRNLTSEWAWISPQDRSKWLITTQKSKKVSRHGPIDPKTPSWSKCLLVALATIIMSLASLTILLIFFAKWAHFSLNSKRLHRYGKSKMGCFHAFSSTCMEKWPEILVVRDNWWYYYNEKTN